MFCINCGKEIGDATFCGYCGAKAGEAPKAVPVASSGKKKHTKVIVAIVCAVVVLAGAAIGLLLFRPWENSVAEEELFISETPQPQDAEDPTQTPEPSSAPEPTETPNITPTQNEDDGSTLQATQQTEPATAGNTWQNLYIDLINENIITDTAWGGYILLYIDDDDIPELIIASDFESMFFTIRDGAVHEIEGVYISYREHLSYIERENLFTISFFGLEEEWVSIYTIENGSLEWSNRTFDDSRATKVYADSFYDYNEIISVLENMTTDGLTDVERAIFDYENNFILAVNHFDFNLVRDYIDPNGSFYETQRQLIDSYRNRDVKERLLGFEIEEILPLSDSEYQVAVYEQFYIQVGTGQTRFVEFRSVFLVRHTANGFKVSELISLETISGTDVDVILED